MQYTFSGGKLIDSTDKGEKKKENNNVATETKADSTAGGYGRGMGYSNRETAFRWSDGSVTYSNATDYRDAAEKAGKDLSKVDLVSATTYGKGSLTGNSYNYGVTAVGDGSGKSGFTRDIYSSDKGYGKAYDMAKRQAEYLSGVYGYDYIKDFGGSAVSGAYAKGQSDSLNISSVGSGIPSLSSEPSVDWFGQYSAAAKRQAAAIQARTDILINNLNADRDDYERKFDEIARQAYVTGMQAQLKLPQQLAAMGLYGGMSETAALQLAADYENAVNENETNRLYMNKSMDTQIANAQLSANSDIAEAETEYWLKALSAYENQLYRQQEYSLKLMDYQLSADKLKNDSYYDELNYQLALDKQKASAEKTEYDRLSDRADTLADYGIFDGYKQLGYTDSEISAMRSAYIAANTKTVSYGRRTSGTKKSTKTKSTKTAKSSESTKANKTPSIFDFVGINAANNYVKSKFNLNF